MKFKVGDKVRVKDHPILPKDILGLIGTIAKIVPIYSKVEEHYAILDRDPKEQGVERYFGNEKEVNDYLEIYIPSKLEKALA